MTSRKPGLGKRFLGVCFPETEDEQPLEEEPEACLMHSVHCGSLHGTVQGEEDPGTEIPEAFCRSWCDKVVGGRVHAC